MIKKMKSNLCKGKAIQIVFLTIITIAFVFYNIFICRVIHYYGIGMMFLILAALLYRLTKVKYVTPPKMKAPNPSARLLLVPILIIIAINMLRMLPMLAADAVIFISFSLIGSAPLIIVWCAIARYLTYRQALEDVKNQEGKLQEETLQEGKPQEEMLQEGNLQEGKPQREVTYFNKKAAFYSVVLFLGIWLFFGGLVDSIASVKSLEQYEKEIAIREVREEDMGIFPAHIPAEAINPVFYSQPPIWRQGSYVYLEFETTEEYIAEIEDKYKKTMEKLETASVDAEKGRLDDGRWTVAFKNYVGKEHCEVYVFSKYDRYGYAIDRQKRQIRFFYFGEMYS